MDPLRQHHLKDIRETIEDMCRPNEKCDAHYYRPGSILSIHNATSTHTHRLVFNRAPSVPPEYTSDFKNKLMNILKDYNPLINCERENFFLLNHKTGDDYGGNTDNTLVLYLDQDYKRRMLKKVGNDSILLAIIFILLCVFAVIYKANIFYTVGYMKKLLFGF